MQTAVSTGGLQVLCPESSSSDDCACLLIPPVEVSNTFSAVAESARLDAAVRLSSRLRGVEQAHILKSRVCRGAIEEMYEGIDVSEFRH